MKYIVIMWLFLCSVFVHANTVPITRNYYGQIDSFFRRGNDIYSLSDTTNNGYVLAYSLRYPYSGGMAIGQTGDEIKMSPDAIQIATLFTFDGEVECWGTGYVDGTIEIEEAVNRPIGTRHYA